MSNSPLDDPEFSDRNKQALLHGVTFYVICSLEPEIRLYRRIVSLNGPSKRKDLNEIVLQQLVQVCDDYRTVTDAKDCAIVAITDGDTVMFLNGRTENKRVLSEANIGLYPYANCPIFTKYITIQLQRNDHSKSFHRAIAMAEHAPHLLGENRCFPDKNLSV